MYTSYQHRSWLKCACKSPSPCAMQHTQTQGIKAPLLARSCFPATWPVASQCRRTLEPGEKTAGVQFIKSYYDVRWMMWNINQSQESQMTNSLSSRKPTWRIRQKSLRSWWFLAQWCVWQDCTGLTGRNLLQRWKCLEHGRVLLKPSTPIET